MTHVRPSAIRTKISITRRNSNPAGHAFREKLRRHLSNRLKMPNFAVMEKNLKASLYEEILRDAEALLGQEPDLVARMANAAALLHERMGFFWTGFYRTDGQELVLGPFQGPVACQRIGYGRGVCGTAWAQDRTLVVPDVEAFPGHIACSALSRSEIVVPLHKDGTVVGVLDIDSKALATFDDTDARALEKLCVLIAGS